MLLVISAALLFAAPAGAVTVAIVTPQPPTPAWDETLSRLRGELLSVGFEVRMVTRETTTNSEQVDSRAWLESLTTEGGIDAVIDIIGDAIPVAVDIWVVEQEPTRWGVSRVTRDADAPDASVRLAIRAVEVLRSTLLENDMTSRERDDHSLPTPPKNQDEALPQARFGLEVGAAVLAGVDGVGPALLPTAQVDWKVQRRLVVHATVTALGTRPTVASSEGHARVAQQYVLVGAAHRFDPDRRVWPFIALSAGALHTTVEGEADEPAEGQSVDHWSFLVDGSIGAGLSLRKTYTSTLAAHLQLAEPYVAIHFVDHVVATTGRPNLVLTLTVGAWR